MEDRDASLQVYHVLTHIHNKVGVVLSEFRALYVYIKITHVAWITIIIKFDSIFLSYLAIFVSLELIVLSGCFWSTEPSLILVCAGHGMV